MIRDDMSADELKELAHSNFPFDSYRDGQREAINRIAEAFSDGYKYVVLDAPTGSGKSGINTAFARAAHSAYYTTPQNNLVDQILEDDVIGQYYEELKGKSYYSCQHTECKKRSEDGGPHSADKCLVNENSTSEPERICCDTSYIFEFRNDTPSTFTEKEELEQALEHESTCEYPLRLWNALESDHMLTNLFLFSIAPYLEKRELAVIDESHNIESVLFKFVDTTISDNTVPFFDEIADDIPRSADKAVDYITGQEFENACLENKSDRAKDLREIQRRPGKRSDEEQSEIQGLKQEIETIEDRLEDAKRIDMLDEDFVIEEKQDDSGEFRGIVLKPIYCGDFFENMVAPKASKFLLSSATFNNAKEILGKLGVDRSDIKVVSIESNFPVENREVEFRDVTSLKYNKVEKGDLKDMAVEVLDIMSSHPDDKGIVHCTSYTRQQEILSHLHDFTDSDRLMSHSSENSDEVLEKFKEDSGNAVLISVSNREGIDLDGDNGRFNVLVKTPNPFYEDPRVKYRIEENGEWAWFFTTTANRVAQAYGRTTRSTEDWSKFYILDSYFKQFYDDNKSLLPDWFVEAAKRSKLTGVPA